MQPVGLVDAVSISLYRFSEMYLRTCSTFHSLNTATQIETKTSFIIIPNPLISNPTPNRRESFQGVGSGREDRKKPYRKFLTDKNAPKRPHSAYVLFLAYASSLLCF